MSLTLFVGSNDSNLSKAAQSAEPTAYLIDRHNFHQHHEGVCYTSIGDLDNLVNFASLLRQADAIIYVPAPSWTTNQTIKKYSEQYWTEKYLYTFSLDRSKNIINCPSSYVPKNSELIFTLNDQRKSNNKCLWISGASIALGDGVNQNESYPELLAKELNLPLCMLAKNGASVSYAVDQILRSDIRQDDIVVLGIPTYSSLTYYDQDNAKIINLHPSDTSIIKLISKRLFQFNKFDFTDPTILYNSLLSINQVLNFCRKINAKLILAGIDVDPDFAVYIKDIPEYIHLNGFYGVEKRDKFIDISNDNLHPGPLTHKWYFEQILKKIKETP